MQSKQVDLPDYPLTKSPLTQPTPHANHTHRLIIFSYFLTQRLVTATLFIDLPLLMTDSFVFIQLKSTSCVK